MTIESNVRLSAFGTRRRVEPVLQTEAAECGLACLVMVGRYHGHEIDLPSLRRRFSTSLKGMSLSRLSDIAGSLGLETRALRGELGTLSSIQLPCILHWNFNHFVVLTSLDGKGATVLDPALGTCRLSLEQLSASFTGVLLEAKPGVNFSPAKDVQSISLRRLAGNITGIKRVLFQVLGLAMAIELISLILPMQMQVVLDQVLVTQDGSLLLAVTVAFVLLVLVQAALATARAWIVSWMGPTLNAQWVSNLFSHLMRLPLDFFEKRHIGDVASRFASVRAIQAVLAGSFVEAVIDGATAILTLLVLCFYSPSMTLLVAGFCLVYSTMRWGLYRALWRLNEEQLIFGSRQQSELMESVRGIQAIKLANKQNERSARLANAVWATANRDQRIQRLALTFGAGSRALLASQRILLVSLGALFVLQGRFSVGAMVAFTVLADQFCQKIFSLIDKSVEFSMLRLHAQRIADIALAEPDAMGVAGIVRDPNAASPALELVNVSFRYAEGEPLVLRSLSLRVEAGDSVAIIGPSGCGKTTLAKILLGLLQPTEGHVEVDGVPLSQFGLHNYRDLAAAVMQDDQLFAGSIAENISFFDGDAVPAAIMEAARAAAVHDTIMAMPMAYESLVGDMGSSLSGGQKQRVVLARALYRKPKILVLDEATSHLDVTCEMNVGENIRTLACSRIVIAHRPETIATCKRVIDLGSERRQGATRTPFTQPTRGDRLAASLTASEA